MHDPIVIDEALLPLCAVEDIMHSDPLQALEMAREVHRAAIATGNPLIIGMSLTTLGRCEGLVAQFDDALEHMLEAQALFEAKRAEAQLGLVLNEMGLVRFMIGDNATAYDLFRRSRRAAARAGRERLAAVALSNLGKVEAIIGDQVKALEMFAEAIEVFHRLGERGAEARAHEGIGCINIGMGNISPAMESLARCLEILEDLGETDAVAVTNINFGNALQEFGDYAGALERYQEALSIAAMLGDRHVMAGALMSIGEASLLLGRTTQAELHLGNGITLCREIGERPMLGEGLRALAELSMKRNDPEGAAAHIRESIELLRHAGSRRTLARALLTEGELHLRRGGTEEALKCCVEALEMAEGVAARPVAAEAHRVFSDIYVAQGDFERAMKHLRLRHETELALYRESCDKSLKNLKALNELERQKQRAELLAVELERAGREAEIMNGNLITMATSLVEHNEYLESIRSALIGMSGDYDGEARAGLRRIASEIRARTGGEEQWSVFEEQYRRLHGDSIRNLSHSFPELSPTELKVCALLTLGLATKEIAAILSVTVRCVETHRYAIRKKLGLAPGVNLIGYLMGRL